MKPGTRVRCVHRDKRGRFLPDDGDHGTVVDTSSHHIVVRWDDGEIDEFDPDTLECANGHPFSIRAVL